MNFTDDAQWRRLATRIQNMHLNVGDGAADAWFFTQIADQIDGRVHCAFGRTIHVVKTDGRAVAQFLPGAGVNRFATQQHADRLIAAAFQQTGREQGVELRRRRVEGMNLMGFEEVQQFAAVGTQQLRDDHQRVAGEQLRDAFDRHVEEEAGI